MFPSLGATHRKWIVDYKIPPNPFPNWDHSVELSQLIQSSFLLLLNGLLLCPTLCNTTECSTPGFPVPHHLPELAQTHIYWVGDAIQHLILFPPLILLPSIFPSIREFSNELALHIRWQNYWSFSFSISPSNDYSGLISFRIDWFDLFSVQGTLKSLLQHHSSTALLQLSGFYMVQFSHLYMTTG